MVRTLLDGELSKTSEFGRTLDKHLLKLAPLVDRWRDNVDRNRTFAVRWIDGGTMLTGIERLPYGG